MLKSIKCKKIAIIIISYINEIKEFNRWNEKNKFKISEHLPIRYFAIEQVFQLISSNLFPPKI